MPQHAQSPAGGGTAPAPTGGAQPGEPGAVAAEAAGPRPVPDASGPRPVPDDDRPRSVPDTVGPRSVPDAERQGAEGRGRVTGPRPGRRLPDSAALLPEQTRDDTDLGWAERGGSYDDWLREQRPPHWGPNSD